MNAVQYTKYDFMTRKERETRRKKAMILCSLLELMKEKPVEHISIKDIADKAEYSKGNLYIYFKNKDEMMLALFYVNISVWESLQAWAIEQHDNYRMKLGMIGEARKLFMLDFPDIYDCEQFYSQIDFANLEGSDYLPALGEKNKIQRQRFQETIAKGIDAGQIKAVVSPDMLIWLLASFSDGIFRTMTSARKDPEQLFEPEKLHEEYLNFIGSAITTEKSKNLKFNKEAFRNEMLKNFPNDSLAIISKHIL